MSLVIFQAKIRSDRGEGEGSHLSLAAWPEIALKTFPISYEAREEKKKPEEEKSGHKLEH